MKTSYTIARDKIFKDHQFYESRQPIKPVSTLEYERYQHEKVGHDFQSKKVPKFAQYKQSSSYNPLNRKYERVDKPYRELHERKQRVGQYSDLKSDPFSVLPSKHENKKPTQFSRRQYKPSSNYVAEHERRYILPKDREISRANKHYHSQLGISQQRLPVPNRKEKQQNMRNSSSLMRSTLDFSLSGRYELMNRSMSGTGWQN